MHETTNDTRNAEYDETTIGTWIFAQYDCSDGTGGMWPSFHVAPYASAIAATASTNPPANHNLVLECKSDVDRDGHRGKERERTVEIEQRPDPGRFEANDELGELHDAAENRERRAEVAQPRLARIESRRSSAIAASVYDPIAVASRTWSSAHVVHVDALNCTTSARNSFS